MNKKRLLLIILLVCFAILLSACSQEYEQQEYAPAENYYTNDDYELVNGSYYQNTGYEPIHMKDMPYAEYYIAELPYTPIEYTTIVPQTITIFVNDEPFSVSGFTVNVRTYFQLNTIAYILAGTQAQFDFNFRHWVGYFGRYHFDVHAVHITRGLSNAQTLTELTSTQAIPMQIEAITFGDSHTRTYFNTFNINESYYFAITDWGAFLGFSMRFGIGEAIYIHTYEPNISEHGKQVAEDFLRQRKTLFTNDWCEELLSVTPYFYHSRHEPLGTHLYPTFFRLYDFSNNGIPDILIHYDAEPWAIRRSLVWYKYNNGVYSRVWEFPLFGDFFRDRNGQIFSIEGNRHDGFDTVRYLSFINESFYIGTLLAPPWGIIGMTDEEGEVELDRFSEIWRDWCFFTPTLPGNPNEPLTAIRPLLALQQSITEAILASESTYTGCE